jgi:molybdopterin-dependent oxidoreductase alpha subunit
VGVILKIFGWDTKSWVSLIPNGVGYVKPNHYGEILKTIWDNKRHPLYAWRILTRGVCDGCALGTKGLRDDTMKGVHLCTIRLNLLYLNTMSEVKPDLLRDVDRLQGRSGAELRKLGRLAYPMLREKGERGFRRIAWDEALDRIAGRIRKTEPDRCAFYLTSRGLTNEVYYVAQKVARFLGTNNIDNSARVCHAPSTVGLKQTIGFAASTCSYTDWIGSDLLVLIGSNVANNQPVTTKYMYYAKQQGTRIVTINPYREPGLERYWIPSVTESAIFGTKLTDDFYQIHTGGDVAFLNGVLKHLIENDWCNRDFVEQRTNDFDGVKAALADQSWEMLEAYSGATRESMLALARQLAEAKSAVFVWGMGITQHRHGIDNVKAIVNLALARGFLGREKCGLMAIRGHSGVQGGAEVGAIPNQFPGALPVNAENASRLSALWGFAVPQKVGYNAVEMIQAAYDRKLDVLFASGGNFIDTLPEPDRVRAALERVPLRVHQDIVVSAAMLVDPVEEVILLPAQTRYEQRGGGTETTTERRILFSPEINGPRPGEARSEWEVLIDLAKRVRPEDASAIDFNDADQIRQDIARAVPLYEGIQNLRKQGDQVQWGGPRLGAEGRFNTPDGKARFSVLTPIEARLPEGRFWLSTRRGKQFNSMVHAGRDPLNGARRDDILFALSDAERYGLKNGDAVLLRNEIGEFRGRVKIAPLKARNLQAHWPEANVLIARGVCDPVSGIPDYNAVVEVVPLADGN